MFAASTSTFSSKIYPLLNILFRVIPQAVCVRYGLSIGAKCAPLVLALMWILGSFIHESLHVSTSRHLKLQLPGLSLNCWTTFSAAKGITRTKRQNFARFYSSTEQERSLFGMMKLLF
jgi:hypothetical protein